MAIKRLVIDGYGQFEPNNFSAPRTGRIEAQCALDATQFASLPCENGMILAVDKTNKKLVVVDSTAITAKLPVAIVYSTEHIYNQFTPGLKNFALTTDDFYPRLGYGAKADTFTTNTIAYDDTEFTTEALFKTALAAYATTALYGYATAVGAILLTATPKTSQPIELKVVNGKATMPDGTPGVKLQILSA